MDKLTQIVEDSENTHYSNKIRKLQLRSICVDNYKQFIIGEKGPDRTKGFCFTPSH